MHYHLFSSDVCVPGLLVPEGPNVGFVDGGNEPENVRDLCCRQALRNDGRWARIGRSNEYNVGLGIVYGGGDGQK